MDKERLKALRESVNKATLDGSAKAYQEGLTRGANTARKKYQPCLISIRESTLAPISPRSNR